MTEAHARRTDPDTSHAAARAISGQLTDIQRQVAAYARRVGAQGFVAIEAEEAFGDLGSTIRTRISELSARNIVLDSGRRRTHGDSPRQRIVWVHRDSVLDPPPLIDPDTVAQTRPIADLKAQAVSPADKAEATRSAGELHQLAGGFRRQGLTLAAEQIERAAALLDRLAR